MIAPQTFSRLNETYDEIPLETLGTIDLESRISVLQCIVLSSIRVLEGDVEIESDPSTRHCHHPVIHLSGRLRRW